MVLHGHTVHVEKLHIVPKLCILTGRATIIFSGVV